MAENIPTMQGLESQFGSWNPMAYIKASDYSGLADQFRNEEYKKQQNSVQEGTLKNQQSELMNPLLVNEKQAQNIGLEQKNSSDALKLETDIATHPDAMKLAVRKAATALDDQDIVDMGTHIKKTLLDPNATQAARDQAIKMQQYLPEIMAEQRRHKEKMAEVDAKEAGDTKRTGMQTSSAERINQANIDAGRWNKKTGGGGSIVDNLWSGKMKVAERLGAVKAILETGQHPDEERELSSLERRSLQALYDQDAATTEGKLAMQAQGVTARAGAGGNVTIVNKDKPSVRSTPRGSGTAADPIKLN